MAAVIEILLDVALGAAAGYIARNRGRSFWGFFVLGLFFPVIAIIIAACLPNRNSSGGTQSDSNVIEVSDVKDVTDSITDGDISQQTAYSAPVKQANFCEYCGSRLEEGSAYCGNCGAKVNV